MRPPEVVRIGQRECGRVNGREWFRRVRGSVRRGEFDGGSVRGGSVRAGRQPPLTSWWAEEQTPPPTLPTPPAFARILRTQAAKSSRPRRKRRLGAIGLREGCGSLALPGARQYKAALSAASCRCFACRPTPARGQPPSASPAPPAAQPSLYAPGVTPVTRLKAVRNEYTWP